MTTTHFPSETAPPADKSFSSACPPAVPADEDPYSQPERAPAAPDSYTIDPSIPYDVPGMDAPGYAADEKARAPLLPAVLWGIAAAGVALGCRYPSDRIGDAFLNGAQYAADALTESGLIGNLSIQAAFLQAVTAVILLLILWGCGLCAVGQPGVFAVILLRGIGVGCTAASVWRNEQLLGQEQLLTLLPQALTLTLLIYGACCAVRMSNSVFAQLTAGKRERQGMTALGYTARMALAAVGIAVIWTLVWMQASGKFGI